MSTSASLEYIVKVQDRDLKELRKELKSTGQTASRSAESHSKLAGALGGVAKTAAFASGAAALGGVAAVLKLGYDHFKEVATANAQTEAALTSTGKAAGVTKQQVVALGNSIEDYSGVSNTAVQSGENMLLTFTNIRNETGKNNDVFTQTTKTMADMSVALGQDMKSSALQLGKALNDPIKGVTALQRVGVSFTDSQKATITSMVDSGHTMAAQKLILHELNDEFGGSAKAAGQTLPGQIAILKAHFEDLAGAIVTKMMPTLQSIVAWVTAHWPQISAVMTAVFQGIGAVITGVVVPIFGFLINNVIKPVVDYVVRYWPQIEGTIATTMANVRGVIHGVLNGLRAFWRRWGSTIESIARIAIQTVVGVIRGIVTVIRGVAEVIDGLIHGRWSEVWHGLQKIVSGVFAAIAAFIKGEVKIALKEAEAFGKAIVDGIIGAFEGLGLALYHAIIDPLKHVLDEAGKLVSKIPGGGVVKSVLSHIPGFASGVQNFSGGLAVVGENGPELVQLPGGSNVIPMSRGMHGTAAGQTVIQVSVGGSVVTPDDLLNAIEIGLAKRKTIAGRLAFEAA